MKKRKIPHTYVIVFSIIMLAALLTWIVPGGEFQRKIVSVNNVDREVIVSNSFQYIDSSPQTWQIFAALFNGFVKQSAIIAFILIIGGAFWILTESKAIDKGIYSFLGFTKKLEKVQFLKKIGVENLILFLIMLLFSVFGAVFGMSEETIAFTIIFVPLAISMGYDSIVGVSLCFVAAALGFAGAILNPFTIGIAQGLADIPLYSGIEYRLFAWFVINFVGMFYILRYAIKVKRKPQSSLVYTEDDYWRKKGSSKVEKLVSETPFSAWIVFVIVQISILFYAYAFPFSDLEIGNSTYTISILPLSSLIFAISSVLLLRRSVHYFVLNLLFFTILFLIVGVMAYDWYVMEIASIFLALGVFTGLAMNYSPNQIVNHFITGMKDISSAAVIVGLAGGIIVVLEEGKVIDTLLYYVSNSMSDFGSSASIMLIYAFQTALNVFIPSGSGQAALTMPIMSQFADLIGISRQATVMAFQFGDGFTNMITPTSGVLLGVLGVAKIPYEKWLKWVFPFIILLVITGLLLLIPTVTMELNGF